MSVNGWPSKIEELQQQLDIATQRWREYEQAYNTQRQRAEAAEKRAQIAEYQRDRALSYANHSYNQGYIGAERLTWEQYLRA